MMYFRFRTKFIKSLFASVLCLSLAGLCPQRAAAKAAKHAENPEEKAAENLDNVDSQKEYKLTDNYIHSWLILPKISGKSVFSDDNLNFAPVRGYMPIVVFISSWCLPCQRLMPKFKAMEDKFTPLGARILYIFSNDTIADARGFSKEHGIRDNAVIANHDILKAYHHPELPSVYVGDRRGWLLTRYLKATEADLEKLVALVQRSTAY